MKDVIGGAYSRLFKDNASSIRSKNTRKGLLKIFHTKASVKRAEAQKQKLREYEESEWKLNKFLKVPSRYIKREDSLDHIRHLSAMVASSADRPLLLPEIKRGGSPPGRVEIEPL